MATANGTGADARLMLPCPKSGRCALSRCRAQPLTSEALDVSTAAVGVGGGRAVNSRSQGHRGHRVTGVASGWMTGFKALPPLPARRSVAATRTSAAVWRQLEFPTHC